MKNTNNISEIKQDRKKWLTWKNIAPLRDELSSLKEVDSTLSISDIITISSEISLEEQKKIENFAKMLRPWRKGPFKIFDTFIDSEWNSSIKYNLLKPYFNLKDKKIADIGCNNGYYMFKMLEEKPKKIVGFDPSPLCKTQFDFINHYIKSDIEYELLGIEHLEQYGEKFDTIFCLGVLYHRSDPIGSLKSLKKGLEKDGILYLDTFMIDGEDEIALTPNKTYSKIPNIYFIPTVSALKNWCLRAGFKEFEVLEIKKTELDEQRKTDWILGDSLGDFLDPKNPELTIEGYPAPKRVYIKASI